MGKKQRIDFRGVFFVGVLLISISGLRAAASNDNLTIRIQTGILIGTQRTAFEPSKTFRSLRRRSATCVGRLRNLLCCGMANAPPTHSVRPVHNSMSPACLRPGKYCRPGC